MSIEQAKARQMLASDSVAAIGRIDIESTDPDADKIESVVEILALQTQSLHNLCLCMRDFLIELDNTGPDGEKVTPEAERTEGDPGVTAGTDGQKESDGIDK